MGNHEIQNGLTSIDHQVLAKALGENLLARSQPGAPSPLSLFAQQHPNIVQGVMSPIQAYAEQRGYGAYEAGEIAGIVLVAIMSLEQAGCDSSQASPNCHLPTASPPAST